MSSKKFKVIITDAEYQSFDIEKKVLSKLNVELIKFQCRTEVDLIKNCKDADAVLNQYAKITPRVIEKLDNVKIIARYGIGVDNVDLGAATKKGIFVTNVVYDICDVADHTITLMLALTRKLFFVDKSVKKLEWNWKKFHPITRIKGKTVGIIGLGRVGREVAKRINGFDVNLLACDPYISADVFKTYNAKKVEHDTLLRESDIVTLHVPLTDETRYMVSINQLSKMKKTSILINCARGGIVDEKALYKALKEKEIAGAGLDVLEQEPIRKDNPLLNLDNVIITPHMGWYSENAVEEVQRIAAEQVLQCLQGGIPINLVNKEVLKKL
ncbi:MAG: C-terminal binding protein [Candidatus Thermoplasmatota archaeon]|nr:C-terminal binding protein [Candidatus Thermoplasmatota archaeon]